MEVRQQFAAERCRPCRAVQTAEAISHTDSARMKALGAATAGLQIRQCINAAATAQAQGDPSGGMAINFSIGSSSSRSTSESSADSAQGSRVLAGGDIVFIAEGADKGARECSDILIRGSELSAGKTARLKVGYWNVAQQKAQGLEGVYPETWLLDAKAVLDLGKLGIRVLAGSGKGSLDALHALSKASADDLAKVNNNALRDDWQQFDHYRKPGSTRLGGEWDWQKQAPNNGAVPGTSNTTTIEVGNTLDRYGSRNGEYMSPVDTPLEQRALPPGKQADPYEQYAMLKPFTVVEEKIAPAFSQPGGGVQMRAKIPEIQNRFATIDDLIRYGYLKDPTR
jgi:hypothetical protein